MQNRLTGRMELMQGYRRVANMIEIEVEMDVDVPAAEVEGIEEQLTKLEEVESLQAEMEYQAEAQDEVCPLKHNSSLSMDRLSGRTVAANDRWLYPVIRF